MSTHGGSVHAASQRSTPVASPPPEETQSGGQASSATLQTPSEQRHDGEPSPFAGPVVEECLQCVQRFRGGEYSREEAIFRIFDSLGSVNQPMPIIYQAARPYIDMLDKVITEQRGAEERGRVISGAPSQGEPDAAPQPQSAAGCSSLIGSKRRRADLDDSDDEDDQHGGRRPLDLSSLPWMQNVQAVSLPQALEDTRQLLVLFAQDPKRWKSYFVNEPNCPQFPDSEWSNVILGKPVNLDLVLASMFSVTLEQKHKEWLGRVSFSLDDVAPARVVRTQGDWLSAWKASSDAITFIFHHRHDELDQYSSYMSSMFTSVLEGNHGRVLCYDKAIRLRASSRRDILLTDLNRFSDLHTLWLSPLGAGPSAAPARAGGARSAPKPGKTSEACRRWNDGKCPFTPATCNWGHVCLKCGGAHVANACSQRG